jgi:hypothetical protein
VDFATGELRWGLLFDRINCCGTVERAALKGNYDVPDLEGCV